MSDQSRKRPSVKGRRHDGVKRSVSVRTLERERAVVEALRAQMTAVTERAWQASEKAQEKVYSAYAAEADPLGTGRELNYRKMVSALREAVRKHVPRDAALLVISRGDDDLIDLYGRDARHFPRGEDGKYAGYYPRNGLAAIAQLEGEVALGARFLLLPATSAWWLDHYAELRDHLYVAGRPVFWEDGVGRLFDLRQPGQTGERGSAALETLLAEIESIEGVDPSVLDLTGRDLAAAFPHRAIFTPISKTGAALPYVDDGADVVVVDDDERRTDEVTRIARTAVVRLGTGDERHGEVSWQSGREEVGPAVSIIVPCTGDNAAFAVDRVLSTLPSHVPSEVIAVFSGRQPPWLRSMSGFQPLLRTAKGLAKTLAAVYEVGAQEARAQTLVLFPEGAVALPGWLPPLVRALSTSPDARVVGGLVLSRSGSIAEAGGSVYSDGSMVQHGAGEFTIDAHQHSFVRTVDFCSAGPIAVSRETFQRAGGLDPDCKDPMVAIVDLCFRMTKRSGHVYFQPESASVALQPGTASAAARNGQAEAGRALLTRRWRSALRRQKPPSESTRPRSRVKVDPARRALVVSRRPPELDRESGSRRLFHLIQILRETGWDVTFGADEDYGAERGVRRLQQTGIETYVPLRDRLEELLVPGRFDLALVAFWENAEALLPRIRRSCPDTRVLVDMIDLHFLREARSLLNRPNMLLDQEFAFNTAREINTYALADAVLAVSAKEAALVNDLTNDPRKAIAVPDFEELAASPIPRPERRGIAFVGNFWHPPNREALRFLFQEIVPRLDAKRLERHPIKVIGNKLEEALPHVDPIPEGVQLIGWVPSVVPYLEQARVSVIPLRTGAGTKRKLVQALMIGTPTVSTSIGTEGMPLLDGEHVLVADDPEQFARSIERLLTDGRLWDRLAERGREVVLASHGPALVRDALARSLDAAFAHKSERNASPPSELARSAVSADYDQTLAEVREAVERVAPEGATVYVVNRGDADLLAFEGRVGRHFPEAEVGTYAGYHPADSEAAVAFVREAISSGGDYLVVPGSAFWWLGRYPGFQQELESLGGRVWSSERCIVYALKTVPHNAKAPSAADKGDAVHDSTEQPARDAIARATIEARRPTVACPLLDRRSASRLGKALVTGIYLADRPNAIEDITEQLADSAGWEVAQRWVALGGNPPNDAVAAVTARVARPAPKFELLNAVLTGDDLAQFDYVLVVDDDIVLPRRFLDTFLALQHELGFVLAQPARTPSSFIDHPIVEQQRGALARQTRFVEIGPVFSVHRSAFDLVFPFDLASPMGWGYENVWAYEAARRKLRVGIIDATPIDHGLRKPVANYDWHEADRQRSDFLAKKRHLPIDQCYRVVDLVALDEELVA